MGDRIPSDHNYRLYSALVQRSPELKKFEWQLMTITGVPSGDGWIKLGRLSELGVRCHVSELHHFAMLDKQVIRVGQSLLQLGESCGKSVEISDVLQCRVATIKTGYTCRVNEFQFGVALGKQMQLMGIDAIPELGERKALKIKETTVIGFSLKFCQLKPKDAAVLLVQGVGGRRKIGCGVFHA